MAEITLPAATGRTTGSGPSKRLRSDGRVPATVYGLGGDAVSVSVDWRELRGALTTDAGLNALINLEIDGHASELTIVKDLQRHPIRRSVLHLDFLRVSRDVAIEVDVPIVLYGEAEDVTREDGVVDHLLFQLTIRAKPGSIPNEIAVDISGLAINDSIRVGDLTLPEGVETDADPDEPIVIGQPPRVEEPEPVAEGEEGEEAAEGEAAAGEAPSEGGGAESSGGGSEG
ncbi:MAG TPA: 50S ribosomal protein L25 [Acidimicrobiales bacterium]|jgi:large subunit ribosomal protein L25|nr:50S ribosomal protein L25 [Acidimicrobiales bacterium]